MIHKATAADRRLFLTMWKDYLTELRTLGGEMLPTEKTMAFFGNIFDAYTTTAIRGVVMMAGSRGVLMEGAYANVASLDTMYEPMAHNWGGYTRPAHRRKGVSRVLRESMNKALRELGFKTILAGAHAGNPVGAVAMRARGFETIQDLMVLRLEE